jgi:dipeptidyl aminopeptidase/acylaminoacyl peptidase
MNTFGKFLAQGAVFFVLAFAGLVAHGEPRPVTVRDCVQVRYIDGVWLNAQGTRVAYLVKAPDLNGNSNRHLLYIKELADKSTSSGKLLLDGGELSSIRWLGDGDHLAMISSEGGNRTLVSVDVQSGFQETLLTLEDDIEDFAVDGTGRTLAYITADEVTGRKLSRGHSNDEIANGYLVPYQDESSSRGSITAQVHVQRRKSDGTWTSSVAVSFEDPFTHEKKTHLRGPLQWLTLSPNGKRLTVDYWSDYSLKEWDSSPWVQFVLKSAPFRRIMLLKDLETEQTVLGFKSPFPDSGPLWSLDSSSFLMNAHSPSGTVWEQEDIRDHRTMGLDANLFWVDVVSGKVEQVLRHPPDHHEGPMFWRADGDVIVHMLGESVGRFHHDGESWQEVDRIKLPDENGDEFWWLTSNGTSVVGVHQAIATPEDLFIYEPETKHIRILTDLNPELKQLQFAPVKRVAWKTKDGLDVDGLLFIPPDYVPGRRYPLVIQTKGDQGQFTCDSGHNHDPAFAPQPTANAGLMYLVRTVKPGYNQQDEVSRQPTGYPGQISEAVQQMDMWDSAVNELSKQNLIDPSRVGIIGFSRTGWGVEFDLVHAKTRYLAATAADNVQFSLGEYWLDPGVKNSFEAMYGGPPNGKTLANWLEYSISFNLDKVHTPLLIENMGYGVHDDVEGAIPRGLATRLEVFKGLGQLSKPVEMYYYPDEVHTPDHPKARLASLQRNLDWYRFWLQGYERPNPEDPDQYKRWEHLRELRDTDAKISKQIQPNSSK